MVEKTVKAPAIVRLFRDETFRRGVVAILVFLVLWEIGAQFKSWFGVMVPFIGKVAPPSAVVVRWLEVGQWAGYWESWYLSTGRVFLGFVVAQVIGIPFGLAMAVNKYFRGMFFPPFEILRPIPPLAWVPASIIFWPTTELSIMFVTFFGCLLHNRDQRAGRRALHRYSIPSGSQSMGASQWDLFRKIILPGTLPSIFIGAAVGMGITWEVVLAARRSQAAVNRAAAVWASSFGELLYGWGDGPSYRGHDQYRTCRLHFEQPDSLCRLPRNALAAHV